MTVRPAFAIALSVLCGALLAGLVASAALAGRDAPEPFLIEPTEMRRETGKAWHVTLPPEWKAFSDGTGHWQRSTAVLLEDGRPLGPAHAIHDTIRAAGGGAYSHWFELLYFSTSDGSDPRTNGRAYVVESGPRPTAAASVARQPASGGASPAAGTSTTE